MFNNVGDKLKSFTKVLFGLGCVEAVAVLVMLLGFSGDVTLGLLIGIVVGAALIMLNLIGAWFIYGFGELIESTQETNRLLHTGFSKDIAQEEEKRLEEAAAQEKAKKNLQSNKRGKKPQRKPVSLLIGKNTQEKNKR